METPPREDKQFGSGGREGVEGVEGGGERGHCRRQGYISGEVGHLLDHVKCFCCAQNIRYHRSVANSLRKINGAHGGVWRKR